jgi:signal transduction histidine kinase
VFDRFYRSDPARSTPGAGLGLSIAKAIVEDHGGSISISTESEAGTVMRVTIPNWVDMGVNGATSASAKPTCGSLTAGDCTRMDP